jgi:hypothetical protein
MDEVLAKMSAVGYGSSPPSSYGGGATVLHLDR